MSSSTFAAKAPLLKYTLLANAGFSLLCGLALLFFPASVAAWLGHVPRGSWMVLGVLLTPFALGVYWVQRHLPATKPWARDIFIADVLWVLLTPVVLWWFGDYLSTAGYWLVVNVAVVVAVFAVLEWLGLQRLSAPPHARA